ncbi:hypothetical protein AMTR_s00068p00184270 [Amborella trichopoda]|uniref:E2 ubiquitin-conjugating enzyme n=1 Tax=Amborella trichopoda TaxID=13333 RepID=U5DE79_AMBTC|nr:hypothetical protein AMTR_s00068p00184270 [Amborella trichopoda]
MKPMFSKLIIGNSSTNFPHMAAEMGASSKGVSIDSPIDNKKRKLKEVPYGSNVELIVDDQNDIIEIDEDEDVEEVDDDDLDDDMCMQILEWDSSISFKTEKKEPVGKAPKTIDQCIKMYHPMPSQELIVELDLNGPHWVKNYQNVAQSSDRATTRSSSLLPPLPPKREEKIGEALPKFKQFDTVKDFLDHHYFSGNQSTNLFNGVWGASIKQRAKTQTSQGWSKKIQQDWSILEKDLPDTIYVRVCEERMDLMRAAIVGPAGTPYHDGLFFFDIHYPSNYPQTPPEVFYHSFGLRLNPNLYNNGKVCLSLLNTWHGRGSEMWDSSRSTMLQVLLSIQAIVLNSNPYFNEPGYEIQKGTPHGDKKAIAYNEQTFFLSCKTMIYVLKTPLKHFEALVEEHFHSRAQAILSACRSYMDGVQVACLVDGIQDVDEGDKSSSKKFRDAVGIIYPELVATFCKAGADVEDFIDRKSNKFI